MFGRIRASSSSLDTLDGSPSKILKDDTFSIYEATLMRLKLGARRDTTEVINDSPVNSPCAEESNLKPDLNPATTSCFESDTTMMDTTESDNTSPRVSDHVSNGNSELQKQSHVSILQFFKVKDARHADVSSSEEATTSTRNGNCSESISSTCVESDYRSEVEDCEMSD